MNFSAFNQAGQSYFAFTKKLKKEIIHKEIILYYATLFMIRSFCQMMLRANFDKCGAGGDSLIV